MINKGSSCPACGAQNITGLYNARDYLVSGREYLICRCNSCGMGWTSDPPLEEEAGSFYVSEEYISHTDRKQSLSDYLYHVVRNFMLGRKRRLVSFSTGKQNGVLLDIGSGTGYFAAFMSKRGWKVTGIEISDNARKFSVNRFGISALSPAEIKSIPARSADCITFWHVLEHMYDPAMWLSEVNRILFDDGKCIIALPNFSSSDSHWFGKEWAALDVPRHIWHFSPDAFRIFAGRNGFKCDRIVPLPFDLFYISMLSYRNRGISLALIRGLITGVLLAVRNSLGREKSSSLVYILSKKES